MIHWHVGNVGRGGKFYIKNPKQRPGGLKSPYKPHKPPIRADTPRGEGQPPT